MPSFEEVRIRRLAPGQCLRVRNALGRTIRCRAGAARVTQENDARDRYLPAGEALTFDHSGLARIYAAEGMRDEWLEDTGITLLCLPAALAISR